VSTDAHAWNYLEHVDLGGEGYRQACGELARRLGAKSDSTRSGEVQVRYEIACGNLGVVSGLYGQATGLAGDFLKRPKDLLSASVGKKVASRANYIQLALVNSSHFHPLTPRVWREHHERAVSLALEGASRHGLAAIDAFEVAFYYSAFADHFLHDSFVSGHMGFNRAASSVSASLAYHNEWNRRGRTVRSRAGESWKTYGDGHLNRKENEAGRAHALAAAKDSILSVLVAFVEGKPDPSIDIRVWRALPFVIDAPSLPSLTDRLIGDEEENGHLYPLAAINRPARKDKVLDLRVMATGTFENASPLFVGLVGFNLSLPHLPTRTRLAGGISIPRGDQDLHLMLDFGFLRKLGYTMDGFLTHQLSAGFLWEGRTDEFSGRLHASYQLTFEIGLDLLRFEVGPAFVLPDNKAGFICGISYGHVFSASGGGVR